MLKKGRPPSAGDNAHPVLCGVCVQIITYLLPFSQLPLSLFLILHPDVLSNLSASASAIMSNLSALAWADSNDSLRANQPIVTWAVFFLVALASSSIGANCQRVGLPSISGYLITGIICGPDVLQIFQRVELSRLSYVNDFVIAFISISSGAELYIPHVKELLVPVLVNTVAIGFLTLPVCMLVGFGMGGTVLLSWPRDYSVDCRWGLAAVAGGIFMGRSPASIIAIIAELKVPRESSEFRIPFILPSSSAHCAGAHPGSSSTRRPRASSPRPCSVSPCAATCSSS